MPFASNWKQMLERKPNIADVFDEVFVEAWRVQEEQRAEVRKIVYGVIYGIKRKDKEK